MCVRVCAHTRGVISQYVCGVYQRMMCCMCDASEHGVLV